MMQTKTLNMIPLKAARQQQVTLRDIKDAKRASDKARRQQYGQTRADQERNVVLVGEAVMRRLGRDEWTKPMSGR